MNAVDALLRLLSPATVACLLCGKPNRAGRPGSGELPSHVRYAAERLCRECCGALPWIEPQAIACHTCGRAVSCPDCLRGLSATLIRSRSAVHYDQSMKELLARYKYYGDEQLLPLLSAMLYPVFEELTGHLDQLRSAAAERRGEDRGCRRGWSWSLSRGWLPMSRHASICHKAAAVWDAITYVPISSPRAQERGFNQAQQLAQSVAERYGLSLMPLLSRVRDSPRQSHQTRGGRLQNTADLFVADRQQLQTVAVRAGRDVQRTSGDRAMTILIVDDIYTTGSTLRACADALAAGSTQRMEVYGLAWARG